VQGRLTAAALLVFAQAAIATADLGIIGDAQFFLAQMLALAERVAGVRARAGGDLLAAGAPPAPAAAPAAGGQVAVRLEGVSFTYRGRPEPTLDGLDLEVPAGQSL